MSIHMVAGHAIRPAEDDIIFGIAAQAAEAAKIVGIDKIINASIGTLLEDDGSLVAFSSVYDTLKNLPDASIAAYAPLAGDPAFLNASVKACFGDCVPDAHIRAVATPGGTGAVKHAITNFTNPGDTVLTADWYWAPYKTICDEYARRLDTFVLFNEKGTFNMEAYGSAFSSYLARQKRLLVVLNTPAHNPTGYTVADEEWDEILTLAKDAATDEENRIVFLIDAAYVDFAGEGVREFMKKFSGLPANILILFAWSASKSYTMYGLRNGALLAVSSDEEIVEEVFYSCAHSNRGTWSNGTKSAMAVVSAIYADKALYDKVEKERNHYRTLLNERGDAFLQAAKEAQLPMTTYCGGFFVSIPCSDPAVLSESLMKQNLFTVPLQGGIRLALCAVPEEKCRKIPALINAAMA